MKKEQAALLALLERIVEPFVLLAFRREHQVRFEDAVFPARLVAADLSLEQLGHEGLVAVEHQLQVIRETQVRRGRGCSGGRAPLNHAQA